VLKVATWAAWAEVVSVLDSAEEIQALLAVMVAVAVPKVVVEAIKGLVALATELAALDSAALEVPAERKETIKDMVTHLATVAEAPGRRY